ncbi:MAG: hypothetical protein JNK78_19915 [Planctomycetes bacterium]|nr:hypothetical protein [Planctomycetota bacterium]
MLLKALFWLFVAIDAAGLGFLFVLGLAAAGPSKTHPLAVVFALFLVPGLLLAGAIALHLRSPSAGLRLVAFLVVSAPTAVLAIGRLAALVAVATNPGGVWGETPLTRALRELPQDPTRMATVRSLLANGADPNQAGEDLPLVLAIRAARTVGDEALRLLLDGGADPNQRDEFGSPAFFSAIGVTVGPAVLGLLLERGADAAATGRDGRSAAWMATNVEAWNTARMLVDRGAGVGGRSPMGLTLVDTLEDRVRTRGDGNGLRELLVVVRAKGK